MDRATFAQRQADMTSNWYEGVKRREGDVDAYIARRQDAYLDRWREAGRFIQDGATVLDVGGGNLYSALIEYLKGRRFDYHYLDVDQSAVEGSRALAVTHGFPADRFASGFNDCFSFPDSIFDAIFSSHCIEHSFDLSSTFRELNRILKPGGNLLMAVPFGWEENPEHPYFFGPNHWIALVEDAGFEIRVAQVGREYPETGHDFFIAARKVGAPLSNWRIEPAAYQKESFRFVAHDDSVVRYQGDYSLTTAKDGSHLRGSDWAIRVNLPGAVEVLPIFRNHGWSGIVQITGGGQISHHDLFSWFPTVQPARHLLTAPRERDRTLTIQPCGKNPSSRATEAVVYGFMYR
ncbi:class I SAM-dependent methyltransferase [Paraburkholderia sp. J12]|uniref:class I SAM-dependent methyltransferase n=1 Tax=Paraburkholderia sp. J12 TaxID=2805432 RepID=UPI002ABE94FB|nr:class I SAM-dependent methyltransferase [Paraburkholderia sp. J12]